MTTQFFTISDLPNYEIAIDGVIRDKRNGRLKKQRIGSTGYAMVTISLNNKSRSYRVHRLLAQTFIPNPNNLPTVNHKDGNKLNNELDNLEWLSVQENIAHAIRYGLVNTVGESNGQAVLTERQVIQIKKLKGKYSQKTLGKMFGVSQSCIYFILTGKKWKHVSVAEAIDDVVHERELETGY